MLQRRAGIFTDSHLSELSPEGQILLFTGMGSYRQKMETVIYTFHFIFLTLLDPCWFLFFIEIPLCRHFILL